MPTVTASATPIPDTAQAHPPAPSPDELRCMVERLACQQFEVFIRVPRRERWAHASRQPSREIHAAIVELLNRKIRDERQGRVISSAA